MPGVIGLKYQNRTDLRAIQSASEAIEAVSGMNSQIAAACEQQAATSLQINENIHAVATRNTEVSDEASRLR